MGLCQCLKPDAVSLAQQIHTIILTVHQTYSGVCLNLYGLNLAVISVWMTWPSEFVEAVYVDCGFWFLIS